MPKQPLKAEVNAFVKGLITEASPLNFPPNSTKEELNFLLKRTGERSRRLGIDFEESYQLVNTGRSTLNHTPGVFVWSEPNGYIGKLFCVTQFEDTLYFFDMSAENISLSGYLGSLSLTSADNSFIPVGVKFSFTSLDGYLVVAAGQESIAVVSYNGTGFTVEYGRIQVRDLWGIEV